MITSGVQTSQIKTKSNKKPLIKFQEFLENLSLKFLCDIIFQSLPGQSDILGFRMVNFHLDGDPYQPNFSNHTKFKQPHLNTFLKILLWS